MKTIFVLFGLLFVVIAYVLLTPIWLFGKISSMFIWFDEYVDDKLCNFTLYLKKIYEEILVEVDDD